MEDPSMPQEPIVNSASAVVPGSSNGGADHAASGVGAGPPIGPAAEGESRTPRTGPRDARSTVAHLGTAAALTTVTLSGRKLGELQRVVRRAALVAIQTAVPRNQAPVDGPVPGARGPGPIASSRGKPGTLGAAGWLLSSGRTDRRPGLERGDGGDLFGGSNGRSRRRPHRAAHRP